MGTEVWRGDAVGRAVDVDCGFAAERVGDGAAECTDCAVVPFTLCAVGDGDGFMYGLDFAIKLYAPHIQIIKSAVSSSAAKNSFAPFFFFFFLCFV